MTTQSPSDATPAMAPGSRTSFVDLLPPNSWLLELCYQCNRLHEEGLKELQASKPGYDSRAALEIIGEVSALLDRLMAKSGLAGPKREMAFAFWERGLQPDAVEAVQDGMAAKIRDDADGQRTMMEVLKRYMPDPGHQSERGVTFYGGAALCIRLAELAGLDRDQVINEAFEQLLKGADRTE